MARTSRQTYAGRRAASRAADARGKLPVNSVAPAITGTETVGQTLSLSNGTWSNTPDAYAYIWKRDGVVNAGETAATYTLAAEDEGAVISASVVATNSGVSAVADSNSTGAITAA